MCSDTMPLPDFLIIGAPKSGTWWLASRIRRHPRVFLARGEHSGEVKYFTKYFHKPLSYYSDLFRGAGDRVKGEKSPHYCTLAEDRIRYINDLMPDIRLILILRDPIERSWSEAMAAMLRNTHTRFEDLQEHELLTMLDRVRIRYSVVIDRWLKFFGRDQFHICFFEDILSRPQSLLARVFRHIGVSEPGDYAPFQLREVVNKGKGIPLQAPYSDYLRESYAAELDILHQRFGVQVDSWLQH